MYVKPKFHSFFIYLSKIDGRMVPEIEVFQTFLGDQELSPQNYTPDFMNEEFSRRSLTRTRSLSKVLNSFLYFLWILVGEI